MFLVRTSQILRGIGWILGIHWFLCITGNLILTLILIIGRTSSQLSIYNWHSFWLDLYSSSYLRAREMRMLRYWRSSVPKFRWRAIDQTWSKILFRLLVVRSGTSIICIKSLIILHLYLVRSILIHLITWGCILNRWQIRLKARLIPFFEQITCMIVFCLSSSKFTSITILLTLYIVIVKF